MKDIKDICSHLHYNRLILKELKRLIKEMEDLHFIQVLWALNLIDGSFNENHEYKIADRFYEEASITWEKIKARLDSIKNGEAENHPKE